jgi:hypothetical protein
MWWRSGGKLVGGIWNVSVRGSGVNCSVFEGKDERWISPARCDTGSRCVPEVRAIIHAKYSAPGNLSGGERDEFAGCRSVLIERLCAPRELAICGTRGSSR